MRYVVVGLHAAGRSACMWLRKADKAAEIVGLDPSPLPVYSRPLISYVLAGEMASRDMVVAGDKFWREQGVTVLGDRAVALDPARASLQLASGGSLSYDRLLLACGARPRPAGLAGPLAGQVCYFRGRRDLERILDRVRPGGAAAVLGGGLVGFKLTMGLLKRGMRVALIVTSPRPLSLNVDAHVGNWVGERLQNTPGVTLLTSTSVTRVEAGTGTALRLDLDTGQSLEVDLVAVGKGVVPETGWLSGSGLECDYGVVTDQYLRTADDRVYAAGDLAQAPDLIHGDRRVNAIWPVAVEQGRVAAMNMAGVRAAYGGSMAMNAIPVFGSKMISVGVVNPSLTKGCDEVTAQGTGSGYLKLVFREERLIGAVGLDAPPRLGELAFAIRRGMRRRDIPSWWLDNPKRAAPLAAPGGFLARNARLA
ncbi:NAD(P)/FAD-dependent oxidoreductase [Solidesulfovibrio alcoholivorans]|uniref:NAD(P)/FAD-dependent oxidoreductase n=1 Tax=Solidesulfovibrio alcoholivorans TaxID=81406 RepID=UPI000495AD80|nr:FAD/NAD(P)-binding oxidoreductase [Solidesulfovibrio alcoholivorans]